MTAEQSPRSSDYGSYIDLNGQHLRLTRHPTDFSVIGRTEAVHSGRCRGVTELAPNMTRMSALEAGDTDQLMDEVRQDSIAHHIYQVEGADEEIIIDDRIILTLRHEGTGELEAILQEFDLFPEGRMGNAYVLRVTAATGRNPLKVANEIAQREGVVSCHPQVMLELQRHTPLV